MPDVFVGMVVGPGLRKTAVVTCASARLYPLRAHLGRPRVFAFERWDLGRLGDKRMSSKSIRAFSNSPWGRKRYLLPLPVLSVLLLGTALASPSLLRMTVNVFDDQNLTILASVQNVVHPSGPDGKLVGLMTVTNHASTDTRITVGTATIESLTNGIPDGRITATISFNVPLG